MKITFLVHAMYGLGGTIRTTLNTASALADRGHEVEIVSVMRARTVPRLEFDPRVPVISLLDRRPLDQRAAGDGGAIRSRRDLALLEQPSAAFPKSETIYDRYSALTDRRVARFLRHHRTDVYVGTRPGLNVHLSQFAAGRAALVGQEHMFHDYHSAALRRRMAQAYRRLDAFVTVTAADADKYRETMPHLADRIHFIPNSVPPCRVEPSDGASRTIIAAGRIEKVKRYDLLIRAFGEVVAAHPDWKLRIYGVGSEVENLRDLISRLGLNNSVLLMGPHSPIDVEWVKGSIAAVTSEYESFGLTIIEAMSAGLPVVSTACPMGPLELINDGVDGLLVTPGDTGAIAGGLRKLIENPDLRHRMSAAAAEASSRYRPTAVAAQLESLLSALPKRRPSRSGRLMVSRILLGVNRYSKPSRPPGNIERPMTHCRVTSADRVEVTVEFGRPITDFRLVKDDTGEIIRIPVVPIDGKMGVTVDATVLPTLSEGVWSVEIDGEAPGLIGVDSRALVGHPAAMRIRSAAAIPYARAGNLVLQVWRRTYYAELDTLDVEADRILIGGELGGVDWATSETVLRLRIPGTTDHVIQVPASTRGTRFSAVIPIGRMADSMCSGSDIWKMWLHRSTTTKPAIRPGQHFDDMAVKRRLQGLPKVRTVNGAGEAVEARAYFDGRNDLVVQVSKLSESPGQEAVRG